MFGGFLSNLGNLAFLVLFGLLALALRSMAREEREPQRVVEAEVQPSLVPAARVARVLAVQRSSAPPITRALAETPRESAAPAEEDTGDVQPQEDVIARLVPQAPIRAGETARSWFGGAPEMPSAMPWPKFSGRRGLFLAQICCADLPEGLWRGHGPRKGWLAFFIDPDDGRELRALHFTERGSARPPPAPGACCTWPHASGPRRIDAFPRWPLDIVAVAPGGPDPRAKDGPDQVRHALFRAGFDLASAEHHPFDWASSIALTDIALAAMARRRTLIKSALPDVEKQLTGLRKQIDLGGMNEIMLKAMQQRAQDLPGLVEGWKEAIASLDAAIEKVQALAEDLRTCAEAEPFSGEAVAALMEQMRAIELTHVERVTEPERGPGAETVRVTRLPLTQHHPDASLFVHDYEALREDWAKHAYCANAEALPTAQRAYFESRWRDLAAHEMSTMGPISFSQAPDENGQSILIAFASSELLKWRFGDDGALVATIQGPALTQGDFAQVTTRISEG